MTLEQVAGRTYDQGATRGRRGRVLVELAEEGVALTGGGVDQHDRRIRFEGEREVGDLVSVASGLVIQPPGRRGVEARHVGEQHRAGREPVVAVPLRRVDRRSEERRVGKEWGSTCRSRWSPEP